MPQLDFTVWSLSVIFTAAAIFLGITAYHLDSESDWELGKAQVYSFKVGGLFLSPLDQFGDSLFWIFGTVLVSTLIIENFLDAFPELGASIWCTVTITTQTVTATGVAQVANQAAVPPVQNNMGNVVGSAISAHPVAAGVIILAGSFVLLAGAQVVATTTVKATYACAKATYTVAKLGANGSWWLISQAAHGVLAAKGLIFGGEEVVHQAVHEAANAVVPVLEGQYEPGIVYIPRVENQNIAQQGLGAPITVQYGAPDVVLVHQVEGKDRPGNLPEGLDRSGEMYFDKHVESKENEIVGKPPVSGIGLSKPSA